MTNWNWSSWQSGKNKVLSRCRNSARHTSNTTKTSPRERKTYLTTLNLPTTFPSWLLWSNCTLQCPSDDSEVVCGPGTQFSTLRPWFPAKVMTLELTPTEVAAKLETLDCKIDLPTPHTEWSLGPWGAKCRIQMRNHVVWEFFLAHRGFLRQNLAPRMVRRVGQKKRSQKKKGRTKLRTQSNTPHSCEPIAM
jgi:hypothetical protein